MGYPDSIINTGATEAIVEHQMVVLPFDYNHPASLGMTNEGTIIVIYRSSGPRQGSGDPVGEGAAAFIYCSRRPADSMWSEPILIHADSILCEAPNVFQIPGSDTILSWYITDAALNANRGMQKNYLASQNYGVRISIDDGVTWSDEIALPEIDRATEQISDTAYKWLTNYGHTWPYPDRNSFVLMPNGDLAGFAGTEGDYEGSWDYDHWRHMYIRIPRNNLFHMNPDGDPWEAVPVGSESDWGMHGSSITAFLLVFDPQARKLASLSRGKNVAFSDDGGRTWRCMGEGGGQMGNNTGGALSLDWWDTTSVLNGWHVDGGGVGKSRSSPCMGGGWGINVTDVERDSMLTQGAWKEGVAFNHHYGTGWYDCEWAAGFEDR
jgi:hypothetical protein